MRAREEPCVWQVRYHPLNTRKIEIFYLRAMDINDARSEFVRWWDRSRRKKKLDMRYDITVNLLVSGREIINPERVP